MKDPDPPNPSEGQMRLITTAEIILLDRSNSPIMAFFPVLPFTSSPEHTGNETRLVNPEDSPEASEISHSNTVNGVNEARKASELAHAVTDQPEAVELAAMRSTEDLAVEEPVGMPLQEMESNEKSSPMDTPTTTSFDPEEIVARDALIASARDPVETEMVPPTHPPVATEGERELRIRQTISEWSESERIAFCLMNGIPRTRPVRDWKLAFEVAKIIGRPIIRNARFPKSPWPFPRPSNGDDWKKHYFAEELQIARAGAGVDHASEVYRKIQQPQHAEGVEKPERWSVNPPSHIPDPGYEEVDPKKTWRKKWRGSPAYHAQWEAYMESPQAYPTIQDGKIVLSSTKPDDHEDWLDFAMWPVQNPLPYEQDYFEADWTYEPLSTAKWNRSGWMHWIKGWLDEVGDSLTVRDIYHAAFFDGTCSADGGLVMFIQDVKHLPTPRDMSDEMTRKHWHETAAGYAYNWVMRNPEWEEEHGADHRKRMRANAFLRPAELGDSPAIAHIMNQYAETSPVSAEVRPLKPATVKGYIKSCRKDNMPFIVAVSCKAPTPQDPPFPENILGYACVRPFGTGAAESHIGDMQVFVRQDSQRKNVGWALIDRILALCDAHHPFTTDNYNWKSSPKTRLGEGLCHPLTSLICTLTYPLDMEDNFGWIKAWLKKDFGFEQQGLLKGARMKLGRSLDAHYLARPIQCDGVPESPVDGKLS